MADFTGTPVAIPSKDDTTTVSKYVVLDGNGSLRNLPIANNIYINRMQTISMCDPQFFSAAEYADVTDGSPALDTASNAQAAADYCADNGLILHIPQIYAKFGAQIVTTSKVCVESDSRALLEWTDLADAGWRVTRETPLDGYPGYAHVHLPNLIGPNDASGFVSTSDPSLNSYDLSAFVQSGLTIGNWYWGEFTTGVIRDWGSAVHLVGSDQAPRNVRITTGTIDLCTNGIHIAPATGKTIGQVRIVADNVFCYRPIVLDSTNANIFQVKIDAIGYYVNQDGGSCLYTLGTGNYDCEIDGIFYNAYAPDSPSTVPTTYKGPFVSGDQTGVSSEAGFAHGNRLIITANTQDRNPTVFPGGDGSDYAVKLKGFGSHFRVKTPQYKPTNPTTSIALSTTSGEANFNGGVGGAVFHPITRCSITLASDLTAGSTRDYYFYHQCIPPDYTLPLVIMQEDNQTYMKIYTVSQGTSTARQARIRVLNYSGSTIVSGTAVNFWVYCPQ